MELAKDRSQSKIDCDDLYSQLVNILGIPYKNLNLIIVLQYDLVYLRYFVLIDVRKGPCWMVIRDGECEANVRRRMTKSECCNTVGQGWGSPCEECTDACK